MALQLDRMTCEEVEEYLRLGPGIAILPSGATEQHGVHGAMGTDTFAAIVVAEKVAELVNGVLLPPLPYGVSQNHLGFAGTITLQPTTLALVIKEICLSLARHGFKAILVITGNRGNEDALRVAAVEARQPGGPHILTMGYQDANKGRLREVLGDWAREITAADVAYGSDGHGGALECSLGMLYCPDGYRPDRLATPDRSLVDARRGLSFTAAQYIEEYAPTGIFGDPHGMSAELGRHVADRTAERIAGDLRRFLELFPPGQR
jgi:creatinine amidohydrolase